MKIKLTQGKSSIVDDNWEHLKKWKWFYLKAGNGYAARNIKMDVKSKLILLHHAIIGFPLHGLEIDHINGDGLDNRLTNLRIVSHRQNLSNRREHRTGEKTSKFLGVYLLRGNRKRKWVAQIKFGTAKKTIGFFEKEEDAAKAYQEELTKLSETALSL